jgi:hypothetical protein
MMWINTWFTSHMCHEPRLIGLPKIIYFFLKIVIMEGGNCENNSETTPKQKKNPFENKSKLLTTCAHDFTWTSKSR